MEFTDLGEAFSLEALKETEKELRRGYRIVKLSNFRDQKDMEVKLCFPDVDADAESSRVYMETMNRLLTSSNKILTQTEMEKILVERGIWGKEQEARLEDLEDRVTNLMREGQEMHSKKSVNKKRLEVLKTEYTAAKKEKEDLMTLKNNFMQNTVEGTAEIEALKSKLFLCTYDMNGERLWTDYEKFKKEADRISVFKLLQEAMIFWAGLPQGVLLQLPSDDTIGEPPLEPSPESQSGS